MFEFDQCGPVNEFNIEFHHARSRRIFGGDLSQEQLTDDLRHHALTVLEGLRDGVAEVILVAGALGQGPANEFLVHGVGRRLSMMIHALETLLDILPLEREQPLTEDEGKDVTRDLNVIYINMVGVIDNLAWCAFHHRAPEALGGIPRSHVGLFSTRLRKTAQLQGLADQIEDYRPWFGDLRSKRDPSAHQIPLYLPPALLGPAEAAEHERLGQRGNDAIARRDFAEWGAIMDQQRRLGRVAPIFLHSIEQPFYRFYPTIPEDIGFMLKLIRVVTGFLHEA
jgi:hypothetical protein